jgi:ADP-ribose pyrophosphatase
MEKKRPYEILQQRIKLKNPWYTLRQDRVRLPNGQETLYNVVDKNDAVWIIPVLADGRVVLINQYRYPIDAWCLELPAGGIPQGQDPHAVARQELQEEIGGTSADWHYVGHYWTMKGIGNEGAYFYLARGVELGPVQHEATEVIELNIVTAAQALAMARSGQIADAPSALALLLCEAWLQ